MLFKLSEKIVLAWSNERLIEIGSEEAYVYGVQLLLSTLLNTIAIAVISAIVDRAFAWIFFLVGFVPIRITAGGFHAKTPLRCSSIFCGSFYVCLLLLNIRIDDIRIPLIIINSMLTIVVVFLFSPLPARNKPMPKKELDRKRVLSLAVSATQLLLSVVFIKFRVVEEELMIFSLGEAMAALFLIIGKYDEAVINKNQGQRGKE